MVGATAVDAPDAATAGHAAGWQALMGAMQQLGPGAAMGAAPGLAQSLGNANVTASQLNAEIQAATAQPNAQG